MDDGIRPIDENGGSELVFERVELGEERDLEERPLKSKVINAGVLVVAALISLLLLANIASSPSTYSGMYETLDEKKLNVMGLVATTTAASAAISVLPDDTGSAIANKLADFASYFVVILSVIYLEKFLLTTFGFLAFGILIPMACVLFAIAVFLRRGTLAKVNLQRLGTKLTAFGLALALVVPASVWLTDNIDKTFDESIAASNAAAQQATQELEESVQEDTQEDKGLLEGIADAMQDGFTAITQGVQDALDNLGQQLNNMIDTVAVMVVTSCLIPLIVLMVFLQVVKIITGLDFGGVSAVMGAARTRGRRISSSVRKQVQQR